MILSRYDGTLITYTETELAALLTRLIAQGQTSCLGNNDISITPVSKSASCSSMWPGASGGG